MERIELADVSHRYIDNRGEFFTALDHISMTWNMGESIAVTGESGSGKSTLARLIIGLERPSSGQVLIDSENTSKWNFRAWRKRRTELQAVFQDTGGTLSPGRSVLQNAEEALCNLTSLAKQQRREKITMLMGLMELSPKLFEVPVRCLSGGEQRRVGLLRSLAVQPRFLILDEVTAGLDLISAEAVLRVLENYQLECACSYLVVTHDLSMASRLCSKLYEIEHGHIIRQSVQ